MFFASSSVLFALTIAAAVDNSTLFYNSTTLSPNTTILSPNTTILSPNTTQNESTTETTRRTKPVTLPIKPNSTLKQIYTTNHTTVITQLSTLKPNITTIPVTIPVITQTELTSPPPSCIDICQQCAPMRIEAAILSSELDKAKNRSKSNHSEYELEKIAKHRQRIIKYYDKNMTQVQDQLMARSRWFSVPRDRRYEFGDIIGVQNLLPMCMAVGAIGAIIFGAVISWLLAKLVDLLIDRRGDQKTVSRMHHQFDLAQAEKSNSAVDKRKSSLTTLPPASDPSDTPKKHVSEEAPNSERTVTETTIPSDLASLPSDDAEHQMASKETMQSVKAHQQHKLAKPKEKKYVAK